MSEIYNDLFSDYENTRLVTESEFSKVFPDVVSYYELSEKETVGVLKANYYEDGYLKQIYSENNNHVCVVAATRQGKTSSYVIPAVLSYANMKIKRNMIIADPKGEVYRWTAETLKKQGYRIILINFRDYRHSDYWNPLTPIYKRYIDYLNVVDSVELVETEKGWRNKFQGKIYESQIELDRDIENEKNAILDEVKNMVDEHANLIITVESMQDPTWELGARDIYKGIIFGMLEDISYAKNPITEENFSIHTAISIAGTFGRDNANGYDNGYFKRRGKDSFAYQLAKNYLLDTADNTRSSYLSVLFSKLTEYREITTRRITSCNSFDFSVFTESEKPVALFIDFKDESAFSGKLIALFCQQAYNKFIADCNHYAGNRLERAVTFLIDEFGNMPKFPSFKRVVSASGSRNIWFHVILQSYAQLESVYGKDADIIKDNMNVHIFMGSNNTKTLEDFSRECGKRTRFSPLSALNGGNKEIDNYQLETIPVMPVSRLANLKPGECVITEVNSGYVMLSKLERYYQCKEFNELPLANENDYVSSINPLDGKYNYDPYKKVS